MPKSSQFGGCSGRCNAIYFCHLCLQHPTIAAGYYFSVKPSLIISPSPLCLVLFCFPFPLASLVEIPHSCQMSTACTFIPCVRHSPSFGRFPLPKDNTLHSHDPFLPTLSLSISLNLSLTHAHKLDEDWFKFDFCIQENPCGNFVSEAGLFHRIESSLIPPNHLWFHPLPANVMMSFSFRAE